MTENDDPGDAENAEHPETGDAKHPETGDAKHPETEDSNRREGGEAGEEPGAPLSDLASDVRERREESDREFEEMFAEMDVGELDGEQAWRDLLAEEEGEPLAVGERVDTEEDRDVRVIDNRTCHNCRYFGDPPEVHCTHGGTEIRRVVDTDHYEVVDCPMVVDEEDLVLPDAE